MCNQKDNLLSSGQIKTKKKEKKKVNNVDCNIKV